MENETYIYNDLEKIFISEGELKNKFADIADYIYEKYNLRAYFCELFESRWSFIAGNNDICLSIKKIKLSNKFGLIIEEKNVENEKLEILIFQLKLLFAN